MKLIKFLTSVLLAAMVMVSCSSDDNDPSPEQDDFIRPEGSKDIISDEQLHHLIDIGAVVHEGNTPPDISGTYFFDGDNHEVYYYSGDNSWPAGNVCSDYTTYTAGSEDGVYNSSLEYVDCSGGGEGTGIFISGEGDCFTLYRQNNGTFEGCNYTTVSIFSACLGPEGDMIEPRSASINTSLSGEACTQLVQNGQMWEDGSTSLTGYPIALQD